MWHWSLLCTPLPFTGLSFSSYTKSDQVHLIFTKNLLKGKWPHFHPTSKLFVLSTAYKVWFLSKVNETVLLDWIPFFWYDTLIFKYATLSLNIALLNHSGVLSAWPHFLPLCLGTCGFLCLERCSQLSSPFQSLVYSYSSFKTSSNYLCKAFTDL